MALQEQIKNDIGEALKAGDKVRVSALRSAVAAIEKAEKAGKSAKSLTEDQTVDAVRSVLKELEKSVPTWEDAKARDPKLSDEIDSRIASIRAEIAVLTPYVPALLGEDEVRAIVDEVIAESLANLKEGQKLNAGPIKGKVRGRSKLIAGDLMSRIVDERVELVNASL